MSRGDLPYAGTRVLRLRDYPQLLFQPPATTTLPAAEDLNRAVRHRLKLDLTERLKVDSISIDALVKARRG
jgi:hypothetical protein